MFSSQIVNSDGFLEMPISSQGLYFHLGMHADDDGFVTPRKVLRMIGAGDDDLKVLMAKGFVIPFDSGVIVITHWRQNNYIQKDRYTPSIYALESSQLSVQKSVYILDTSRVQAVSSLDAQEGRKEVSKEQIPFQKNQDTLSLTRITEHFEKGRQILHVSKPAKSLNQINLE